ncbi:MAG: hypothetical protein EOO92_17400, partial [Pedobacter sp.]
MKKLLLFLGLFLCYQATFAFPTLSQGNWRWRSDNGAENNAANWTAAQNTSISLTNVNDKIRLRVEVKGLGDANLNCYIQYETTSGDWINVPLASDNSLSPFVMATTSNGLLN